MKKHTLYYEIMDLRKEQKQYIKLCNGRSKKFKYYSDWEDYIVSCLAKFGSPKDLYNFKHFCMNAERTNKQIPDLFVNYLIIAISICINLNLPHGWIAWVFALPLWTFFLILGSDKYRKENLFYRDLVSIIEKVEENNRETTPASVEG